MVTETLRSPAPRSATVTPGAKVRVDAPPLLSASKVQGLEARLGENSTI